MAALIYHISLGKPVDLGSIIFEQLASHALSKSPVHPIGHPSTIYQMILKQAPEIMDASASLFSPKPLIVDWKLFSSKHFVDVTIPESVQLALQRKGKSSKDSAGAARKEKIMNKSVIERLKEQLKSLDSARKETLALITMFEGAEAQKEEEEKQTESESTDS